MSPQLLIAVVRFCCGNLAVTITAFCQFHVGFTHTDARGLRRSGRQGHGPTVTDKCGSSEWWPKLYKSLPRTSDSDPLYIVQYRFALGSFASALEGMVLPFLR